MSPLGDEPPQLEVEMNFHMSYERLGEPVQLSSQSDAVQRQRTYRECIGVPVITRWSREFRV